jgi:hypothetical protein
MGHASPEAALRYQHATRDRDSELAAALVALSRTQSRRSSSSPRDKRAVDRLSGSVQTSVKSRTFAVTCAFMESGRRESNPRSQLGKLMFCR